MICILEFAGFNLSPKPGYPERHFVVLRSTSRQKLRYYLKLCHDMSVLKLSNLLFVSHLRFQECTSILLGPGVA